jgi:hypothetical protein
MYPISGSGVRLITVEWGMPVEKIDTLVVGGGQAGIAMSEHLSVNGVPHLVLERNRVAASNSKTASRSSKCRLTTPPDRPRHPISGIAREMTVRARSRQARKCRARRYRVGCGDWRRPLGNGRISSNALECIEGARTSRSAEQRKQLLELAKAWG